ncbi:hypothetical protein T439DRAFT_377788 [Meredithblackwellia eburnea MCA 4105]
MSQRPSGAGDSGQEEETPEAGSSTGKLGRRYAFACTGCKRRKARCDGVQPTCGRCDRLKESCIWAPTSKPDSSDREQLSNQLHDAVSFLQRLSSASTAERSSLLEQYSSNPPTWTSAVSLGEHGREVGSTHNGEGAARSEVDRGEGVSPFDLPPDPHEAPSNSEEGVAELLHHMSLDEQGSFQHYGSSSLLYQKPPETRVAKEVLANLARDSPRNRPFEHQPDWKTLAYSTLSMSSGSEKLEEVSRTWQLLATYFTWLNPEFHIVTESVFYRDLALSGPYFSRFLLCAMCAHASRYSDAELVLPPQASNSLAGGGGLNTGVNCGADILKEAKSMLMDELEKPTSIATITGLMILGQRECECGNTSLAWLYIGMAWRMLRDLGLHLASKELSIYGGVGLPIEDQEIRLRLFWSAFALDKSISLALGRSPTFNAYQRVRPSFITDLSEDNNLWAPLSINGSTLSTFEHYQPQKSFTMSSVKALASLTIIASEILMRFYVRRPRVDQELDFLDECEGRLKSMFAAWPKELQLITAELPEQCPPPHVVSLNLFYRAITILLYRPFVDITELDSVPSTLLERLPQAENRTTEMATEVNQILVLHRRSFGWLHLTYSMLYSCYAAASIDVIDFLSRDPQRSISAAPRLSMSLKVLEQGAYQSPALQRTLGILKTKLTARPTRSKRGFNADIPRALSASDQTITDPPRKIQNISQAPPVGLHSPPPLTQDPSAPSTSGSRVASDNSPFSEQTTGVTQAMENISASEWPSPILQDLFSLSLPAPDFQLEGTQGTPRSAAQTGGFLHGDPFGDGSLMPMGVSWDLEHGLF